MQGSELIVFLAMAMALSALGIDLLLPAFPQIRAEFGLPPGSTEVSRFITAYFIGLASGQLLIGPLADRFGRRPLLRAGIALYVLGAALTVVAPTFSWLLLARFLWGVGASGGRVLAVAIIRDRFVGAAMAKTMSLIMAVFIIVPVVAPALGAVMLRVLAWDRLVALNILAAVIVLAWSVRLEETLSPERRRTLRPRELGVAVAHVMRHPRSGPIVIALAVLFGGFASYLSTSEVIYSEVFGRATLFPLLFGGMALALGVATLVNSRIVERIGLRRMLRINLAGYLAGATLLVAIALATGGRPPLIVYLVVLAVMLCSHAMIIPNMNARAMEPMGHIAGLASAVNGAVLVGGGALLGATFDRAFDGTVTPLALAFLGTGIVVAVLVGIGESRGATADAAISGTGDPSPGRGTSRRPGDRPASPHGLA
jgi:DHA1 family bicyclomycin/chloramphenicol resistance-like MFS transporter